MSTDRSGRKSIEILNIRFNQDSSCFVCATSDGIRVFNIEPLVQKCFLDVGRVTFAEMFYRTNLIAYVPANFDNGLPSNCVTVHDDQTKKAILEFSFNSSVNAIRMTRTRLLAILINKIHIFSFPNNCQLLHTIETKHNPRGLCEISNNDVTLLAFPFNTKSRSGHVQLLNLHNIDNEQSFNPRIISAHDHELALLAFNDIGTLLATTSRQGTLIRVFSTIGQCEKLYEFRRGTDSALIYSLAFSFDSNYLCVSSDTNTVHIFAIRDRKRNRSTTFNDAMGDLCNFKAQNDCSSLCTFSGVTHVVSMGFDGTFEKFIFNANGQCHRDEYDLFLDGLDGRDF